MKIFLAGQAIQTQQNPQIRNFASVMAAARHRSPANQYSLIA